MKSWESCLQQLSGVGEACTALLTNEEKQLNIPQEEIQPGQGGLLQNLQKYLG